jgi:hypothetical protein
LLSRHIIIRSSPQPKRAAFYIRCPLLEIPNMLDFVIARKVFSLPNLHTWLTVLIPPMDGRAGFFIEGVFLDKSPLDFIHHQGGTNTFAPLTVGRCDSQPLGLSYRPLTYVPGFFSPATVVALGGPPLLLPLTYEPISTLSPLRSKRQTDRSKTIKASDTTHTPSPCPPLLPRLVGCGSWFIYGLDPSQYFAGR